MQEYQDGSMGDIEGIDKMLKKPVDENVKATHFGALDELEALKKKTETGEISNKDFKEQQLNRIEGMLSSVILHLNIPYKGILTIPNTTVQGEKDETNR